MNESYHNSMDELKLYVNLLILIDIVLMIVQYPVRNTMKEKS